MLNVIDEDNKPAGSNDGVGFGMLYRTGSAG